MIDDNIDSTSDMSDSCDDQTASNDSEMEAGTAVSSQALHKEKIQKRRRLSDLLDEKKLRQELEDLEEYEQQYTATYYDDDIFSHYYERGSEE